MPALKPAGFSRPRPWSRRGPGKNAQTLVAADGNILLVEHGDTAWFAAARRADSALSSSDMAGHRHWMAVVRYILTAQPVNLFDTPH
ncbi:MAG: hypothetical protein U5M50_12235 [Sphingobium sp.]|nr:hypothetical protein [Sphingobium sp.]